MAPVKTIITVLYLLQYSSFGSDVNCKQGECKPIEDTTELFCECHKMFRGPACRDACQDKPCGVNAKCSSSSNHDRSCTCESPWKGDPYSGCKSQDLQWVQARDVPKNAVRSKTGLVVCKATGSDGGSHSGFVKDQECHYELDWYSYHADSYEVLVDPCGGSGYEWVDGAPWQWWNMVMYDESRRFPGVKFFVCSLKSNGYVGKLFNTRKGFLCHFPLGSYQRDENFYSLVSKPCF